MSCNNRALWNNGAVFPRLAFILCLAIFLTACGTSAQQKSAPSKQSTKVSELFRKAEAGNPAAQYFLGLSMLNAATKGNRDMLEPGISWVRKAAEQGLPMAENRMGLLHMTGHGVAKDDAIAMEWLTRAALGGYASAQYNLGFLYAEGRGAAKDPVTAEKWLKRAADQDHEKAIQMLKQFALTTETGFKENPEHPEQMIRKLEQAAATGDTMAMYNLGTFYLKGRGVTQNNAEAVKWYRKAADLGLPIAQYDLGTHYSQGTAGLKKDARKAAAYFQQAADQGFAGAQASLGFIYVTGQLGKADPELAVKWFRKSSLQDNVEGNYNLGLCYLNGIGTSQDTGRAEKLIERAADQNHIPAQLKLMELYTAGTVLAQDPAKAYKWTAILATKNPQTQTNPQSVALFSQATSALAAAMSESQLKRARQLVAEWQPVP